MLPARRWGRTPRRPLSLPLPPCAPPPRWGRPRGRAGRPGGVPALRWRGRAGGGVRGEPPQRRRKFGGARRLTSTCQRQDWGGLGAPSRGPACGGAGAPSRGVSQAAGGAGRGGRRAVSARGAALFPEKRGLGGRGTWAGGVPTPPGRRHRFSPPQPDPCGSRASRRARGASF